MQFDIYKEIAKRKIGAPLCVNAFESTLHAELIQDTKNRPFGERTKRGWTVAREQLKTKKNLCSKTSNKLTLSVYNLSKKSRTTLRQFDTRVLVKRKSCYLNLRWWCLRRWKFSPQLVERTINHTKVMKFAFYGMYLRIFEIIIFSALNQLEILDKQPNVDLKISVVPTDSKNIPKSKERNKGFCLYRWLHPVFRHPWERQCDSLASKELSKNRGFRLNIF